MWSGFSQEQAGSGPETWQDPPSVSALVAVRRRPTVATTPHGAQTNPLTGVAVVTLTVSGSHHSLTKEFMNTDEYPFK